MRAPDSSVVAAQPPTPPASNSTTRSPTLRLLWMEERELPSFGPAAANLSWSKVSAAANLSWSRVQVFIGGTFSFLMFSLPMFSLLMRRTPAFGNDLQRTRRGG